MQWYFLANMPSIRLTQFAGLMPELSAKLKRKDNAQIAHNCLLYDGKLRAMPAYFNYQTLASTPLSLYGATYPPSALTGNVVPDFELSSTVYLDGAPFPTGLVGVVANSGAGASKYVAVKFGVPGISGNILPAGIGPVLAGVVPAPFTVTRTFASVRPSVVAYAITALRINSNSVEESPPLYLGTVGNTSLFYEGDSVRVYALLQPLTCGETQIRIYRTVTALETGEQIVNTFDTDWNLVATIAVDPTAPVVLYVDLTPTEQIKGNLLLSEGFLPPYYNGELSNFGVTESGWLWLATNNEVQFSEKYRWHAWSMSGYLKLANVDSINSAVSFYDTIFVGTDTKPFKVKVSYSDSEDNNDPMTVNAYPYPEVQPCIQGTLVTAPFGALYISRNGVVSLEEEKMQVITRDLLNGGDSLYSICVDHVQQNFYFQDVTKAAWFNGWYIGYGEGIAFVYQAPEDLNSVHPFQQLVTMDMPIDVPPDCSIVGGFGLHTAFGNKLYYWPVPGWVRAGDTPIKLPYTWKSKKFVMPGSTNFAAGKVVWECDGDVCFKLVSDCIPVYERRITDCNPFRLPSNYIGKEFEIQLTGTGTVSEVHIATSMQQLTEVETE